MTKEEFLAEYMEDHYPYAGPVRRRVEKGRLAVWLLDKKNVDFIESIPSPQKSCPNTN